MTAKELADRIEDCDHLVMKDSPRHPDDDMIETVVPAKDEALIVRALRAFGQSDR